MTTLGHIMRDAGRITIRDAGAIWLSRLRIMGDQLYQVQAPGAPKDATLATRPFVTILC